ncbi:chemotaxis protein CheX [Trinickia terrae]|uniref:Chemotaxis protein CheX n=1 Tax=Trinickia terrae TaxID=2571161 RepID=A0A4V5PIU6_9BURK|nr:chemotaxis protein CheX [Trinickia terrae]TKC88760.1 chemotaxis protein CheX [Trinickia terrae]
MNTDKPVSKVLVLDDCPTHAEAIKRFCDENNLIGLKVRKPSLPAVLSSNIDLGAILLAEDYGGSLAGSTAIATRIDALRPELPIILRRAVQPTLDGLPPALRGVVCAAYSTSDMAPLRRAIDEYLFSLDYPNALVRGITEITESKIGSLFRDSTVSWDTPCVVRDRIIFGEVFSLIALESNWCRGYMMIQTDEQSLIDMRGREQMHDGATDFRDLNSLLGELTNLIWGAFKDRYLGDALAARSQVQVPLLVNHKQRYISFGSTNPQLCFKYHVTDEASGRSVMFDQRFIFSLSWSPEDFSENAGGFDALVEAGELDLF